MVMLGLLTPFVLFNTVYIWPKLLGAAYGLLVFNQLLSLARDSRSNRALPLAGICAALSLLCHAGNALLFPLLALAFARTLWRQGWLRLATAFMALILVLLPWLAWQILVQPHPTALLRFALTNHFGFNRRAFPILPDVIAAYRELGIEGWAANKLRGLHAMSGSIRDLMRGLDQKRYGPGQDELGMQRIRDFASVFRSVGLIFMASLPLAFRRGLRGRLFETATLAASVGWGCVALTLLAFLSPPLTHHLPSSAVLLIVGASASACLALRRSLRAALIFAALLTWAVVWAVHPMVIALRTEPTAVLAFGLSFGVLLWRAGPSLLGRAYAGGARIWQPPASPNEERLSAKLRTPASSA